MSRYMLPPEARDLILARDSLRKRYANGLTFTLDGNLVGDLGEALAAELFGLKLARRGTEGIDAFAPDGRSVQIKATQTNEFAFTHTGFPADWMIGLVLHFEDEEFEIVYNGPYEWAISEFPDSWARQKKKAVSKFKSWDKLVDDSDRIPLAVRIR